MNLMKKQKNNKSLEHTRAHPEYKKMRDAADARIKFAFEVNRARTAKGWTQVRLAKEAETTQRIISNIESGDVNIGFDLIQRIARCLGLTVRIGTTSVFFDESTAFIQVMANMIGGVMQGYDATTMNTLSSNNEKKVTVQEYLGPNFSDRTKSQ